MRLEADAGSGGVVRLSILPSQGSDPGFKSRPEHILAIKNRAANSWRKVQGVRIRQSGKILFILSAVRADNRGTVHFVITLSLINNLQRE